LRDKPTAARALGLAIGFAGVALLAWDKASFKPGASGIAPAWAVLACLVATLCYGIAGNAAKVYLKGLPALATATGSQIGATLLLAVPALWTWPAHMPSMQAWLALVAVGVLCTGIAYILYFRLIEEAGPSRALAVTFVVPVFAVIYGALFLGEAVTGWMLLCGGVIVCGTALSTGLLRFGKKAP
jgi:drug/metabolite transporter (DMT)-like permease